MPYLALQNVIIARSFSINYKTLLLSIFGWRLIGKEKIFIFFARFMSSSHMRQNVHLKQRFCFEHTNLLSMGRCFWHWNYSCADSSRVLYSALRHSRRRRFSQRKTAEKILKHQMGMEVIEVVYFYNRKKLSLFPVTAWLDLPKIWCLMFLCKEIPVVQVSWTNYFLWKFIQSQLCHEDGIFHGYFS